MDVYVVQLQGFAIHCAPCAVFLELCSRRYCLSFPFFTYFSLENLCESRTMKSGLFSYNHRFCCVSSNAVRLTIISIDFVFLYLAFYGSVFYVSSYTRSLNVPLAIIRQQVLFYCLLTIPSGASGYFAVFL